MDAFFTILVVFNIKKQNVERFKDYFTIFLKKY